jgi:beta-galactosidase
VWRDDEPVVRIAVQTDEGIAWPWGAPTLVEHWNFPKLEGKLVRVQTQTNCDTVELIVNGKHFGVRSSDEYLNRAIVWHVPYAPGQIEAVARKGTDVVARHSLKSSGRAARVELTADRITLAADGLDVAHVEVRLLDEHGILVPDDDRIIKFDVTGNATLIGVDNGDFTDLTPRKGAERQTRRGRCLAIVQSARRAGPLTITASCDALPAGTIQLTIT